MSISLLRSGSFWSCLDRLLALYANLRFARLDGALTECGDSDRVEVDSEARELDVGDGSSFCIRMSLTLAHSRSTWSWYLAPTALKNEFN